MAYIRFEQSREVPYMPMASLLCGCVFKPNPKASLTFILQLSEGFPASVRG
jgi:hypothetical protein